MWAPEFRSARYFPGALLLTFLVFVARTGDGWIPAGNTIVSVSEAPTIDEPTTQPVEKSVATATHPRGNFTIPPFESGDKADQPPNLAWLWIQQENATEQPRGAAIVPTSTALGPTKGSSSSYAIDPAGADPTEPAGSTTARPAPGIGNGTPPQPPPIFPAPAIGASPPPVGPLTSIPEPATAQLVGMISILALRRRHRC